MKFNITETDNVIDLLVSELYAGDPDVSIREAMQNARDANHAYKKIPKAQRSQLGEGDYHPDIGIWSHGGAICISDNGIGMNVTDIEKRLLNIGVTDKANKIASSPVVQPRTSQDGYIGKYGVGVLGYFILAGKVEIYTQSYDSCSDGKWNKLTASIDKNKEVNLEEVHLNDIKSILPTGHPLHNKKISEAHGTIVLLYPRNTGTLYNVEKNFKQKIRALTNIQNVEELISKYCYFLDQDISRYSSGIKESLILGDDSSRYDDIGIITEIFESLNEQDESSKPLLQEHKVITLDTVSDENRNSHVFLYLRDNIVYEQKGFDVYVDGLLVEESVVDIRPTWARFMHGVVLLKGVGTSLDRRSITRQSNIFYTLKEEIEKACIEIFKKLLIDKWNIFMSELWPALDGNFIPKLLQAYGGMYSNQAKNEAIHIFNELGCYLPLPLIRATRVQQKNKSKYINIYQSLDSIVRNNKSDLVMEDNKYIFYYIEDIGSAEMIASKRKSNVIDAVKRGDGANWWSNYLHVIEELFPEYSFKLWLTKNEIESFIQDKHKGWNVLLGLFTTGMDYGELEAYEVGLYSFEPNHLPMVISERDISQENVQKLKKVLTIVDDNDLVKEFMDTLDTKAQMDRDLQAYINTNNEVIQKLAEILKEYESNTTIVDVVRQIIESARVDHYGGKHIGPDVLLSIYGNVRNPAMLRQLSMSQPIFNVLQNNSDDIIKEIIRQGDNFNKKDIEELEQLVEALEEIQSISIPKGDR